MPGRFTALDGWRGICALLVALYHFRTTSHIETIGLVRNAYLFVDFFFVLSGFVITYAYADRLASINDVAVMMWRRLGRLWPLHLAVLAAFVALEVVTPGIGAMLGVKRSAAGSFDPASGASLAAIPTNFFLLHGLGLHSRLTWNFPSWSISAEVWSYLLFALILVLARRWAIAATGVALGGALVVVVALSDRYMAVDYDLGLFRCIAGFLVGSFVFRIAKARRFVLPMPTLVEVAAIAFIFAFVSYAGRSPLEFAAPFVFGAAVWLFAQEQGAISGHLKAPPLTMLGLVSYSIYMVHSLVIALVHRGATVVEQITGAQLTFTTLLNGDVSRHVSFGGPWAMDAVVVAYLCAVIGLARLSWQFIEMPAQRKWNEMLPQTAEPVAAIKQPVCA